MINPCTSVNAENVYKISYKKSQGSDSLKVTVLV